MRLHFSGHFLRFRGCKQIVQVKYFPRSTHRREMAFGGHRRLLLEVDESKVVLNFYHPTKLHQWLGREDGLLNLQMLFFQPHLVRLEQRLHPVEWLS